MWRRDEDCGDREVDLKRGGAGQKWQEGGAEPSEFLSARMREGEKVWSRVNELVCFGRGQILDKVWKGSTDVRALRRTTSIL
jgi:hypothetical protein